MDNGYFYSETYGKLTLAGVRKHLLNFMEADPQSQYRVVIGSDSQPKDGITVDFVTALVIHRVGKGGIYFWKRIVKNNYGFQSKSKPKLSLSLLRERIYQEATLSLTSANEFLETVKGDGISKYDLEIHVDIGKFGETREMITEVVGMIRGNGFICKTKPESYGASKVADRHT